MKTYDELQERCNQLQEKNGELRDILFSIVDELELSETAIDFHGPRGTCPSILVREVLEEKDKIIRMLKLGMNSIEQKSNVTDAPCVISA